MVQNLIKLFYCFIKDTLKGHWLLFFSPNTASVILTTKPAELGERRKDDEIKIRRHAEIAIVFSTVKSISSAKIFLLTYLEIWQSHLSWQL